jgi:hypothetical protein
VTLAPLWSWLEATAAARTIQQSLLLTGFLSALHALGMTLLTGSVIVSSLRSLGLLFADAPAADVTRAARGGILIGLAVSVVTGVLLFSTRATAAVTNEYFQLKMALLAVAIAFYFGIHRRLLRSTRPAEPGSRASGALAIVLWVGVAAAGGAFILLE